jgi:hypothetical protein
VELRILGVWGGWESCTGDWSFMVGIWLLRSRYDVDGRRNLQHYFGGSVCIGCGGALSWFAIDTLLDRAANWQIVMMDEAVDMTMNVNTKKNVVLMPSILQFCIILLHFDDRAAGLRCTLAVSQHGVSGLDSTIQAGGLS